ncbi:MAG: alpha/beta fold hydrolase [Caldilineaceae bacterium]
MPTFNVVGQTVETRQDEHASLQARFDLKVETRVAVQVGATRGKEGPVPVEVDDHAVIELEYSNGVREWTTAGELRARYQALAGERGQADAITITAIPPESAERGVTDFVLKGLKVLGIDPVGAIADKGVEATIAYFESKLTPGPGLYRITQRGTVGDALTGELAASDVPYLLLIHGTFSSIEGTFRNLFRSREWGDLWNYYDGRIVAFNHFTLSESPSENALKLIGYLPKEAKLHIISHSRGGLVGELLCMDAITAADLQKFDKPEHSHEIETLRALSAQLAAKELDVRRFVRVACPARGTLLASQRLDRYLSVMLNLLGLIPGLADNLIYEFAQSTILTLINKKAEPRALPGLEAMMPESPLVAMLNRAGRKSSSDLAVVAGDVAAGAGIFNTLKTWVSDIFYREDHDLVVHTKAMYGGLERTPNAVYYFRRAPDMNHFNYFLNDESRSEVYRWLTQKAGNQPEDFHSLAQVRERLHTRTRAEPPADAPTVILIPGVFASHLKSASQRIWLDLENLAVDRLANLALDSQADITPDGILEENFADLIDAFAAHFKMVLYAYDWRNSLQDEARKLAIVVENELQSGRTVHLLAHSSGGLLARAVMAYARETWDRMCRRGGRLVMLGTPNHGAYAMLEILSGQAELMRMLELLDGQRNLEQICDQFRRYPGLVELLPHGCADWQEPYLATLKYNEKRRFETLCKKAAALWADLNSAIDPARMCYVAGARRPPWGVRTDEGDALHFFDSTAGDGFVTPALGRLAGIPAWTMAAAHGDLANSPAYFSALADLLLTGTTERSAQSGRDAHADRGNDAAPGAFSALSKLVRDCHGDNLSHRTHAKRGGQI